MKKNRKIYYILSFLVLLFCASIVSKELQNDTFSTMKIGDYILHHGVDFVEHFNIDSNLVYHNARWLFTVIIALINNNFGFFGIYIFVILITALIGLTIFNSLIKQNNNIFLSFFVTLVTIYSLGNYISARAQITSYLLFFIEVYSIEKLISTNKKRYSVYIILSSILVANLHTSVWPMTIVLFMPYLAELIISKFKFIKKQDRLYYEKYNKSFIITLIITLFTGLVTPIGLIPYTYMFKTMNGLSSKFIQELQPTNLLENGIFDLYTFVFIFLFIFKKIKIKISDIFMIGGLYLMGLMAVRNNAFLYIISPFAICRLLNELFKEKKDKLKKIENYFVNDKIYRFLFIISFVALIILTFAFVNKDDYVNEKMFPVKASDYIEENVDVDDMRIFNGFNFGPYLEYRGFKVFIDSRSEVFCKEFNDTTALQDWYDIMNGTVNYKDVFKKYNFTHVLLYKDEIISNYIKYDEDYEKIYEDEYFVLYEKK